MRKYFHKKSVPFDFALFTSYERQLESLLNGHIDVAWNGPLAHVRLQRLVPGTISLGMRDVDRDFVSYLVTTKESNINTWSDLRNKRLATGTYDSPQAYVVPMHHLLSTLSPSLVSTIDVTRYDFNTGKHGDTAVGEVHVMDALRTGSVDAGFVSQMMFDRRDRTAEGDDQLIINPQTLPLPLFDHCQFDALPTLPAVKRQAFQQALLAMDWSCPEERVVMELEGSRTTIILPIPSRSSIPD